STRSILGRMAGSSTKSDEVRCWRKGDRQAWPEARPPTRSAVKRIVYSRFKRTVTPKHLVQIALAYTALQPRRLKSAHSSADRFVPAASSRKTIAPWNPHIDAPRDGEDNRRDRAKEKQGGDNGTRRQMLDCSGGLTQRCRRPPDDDRRSWGRANV